MKIRLSKKFVLILGGGLLLCGASGAAAVLIGADRILGPSYRDINGLECSTLQTVRIKKDKTLWVRKYVTSAETADGMTRLKTALRVARSVQEKEHADLVQVAMIDPAGPKDRAQMRGRMVGAQVVYIPDLAKLPEGLASSHYQAFYLDGTPTSKGEFYGMRVDMALEDVEHLEAKLTDKADCLDPEGTAGAGAHAPAAAAGHGAAKPAGHGEAKPSAHGETAPAAHGATPEGGEAAAAEGHGSATTEAAGQEEASAESGGFMSSVTGMLFGSKEEPAAESGGEHASIPAPEGQGEGHGASPEKAASSGGEDHGDQVVAPSASVAEPKAGEKAVGAEASVAEEPAEAQGFFSQVKGMILGGSSEDAQSQLHDEAKADAGHEAAKASDEGHAATVPDAPKAPRTTAEGGKGWSKADEASEIRAEDHAAPSAAAEHAEAEPAANGANAADAAGAAWLEQFRKQSGAPEGEAKAGH